MEPAQLQLVFNVAAITGVSSLASFCYLLRKENRKLAKELHTETKPTNTSVQVPVAASPVTREKDIRAFAAGQRARWVEGMRQRPEPSDAAAR